MSTVALEKHDFAAQRVIYSMSGNNDVIEIVGLGPLQYRMSMMYLLSFHFGQ